MSKVGAHKRRTRHGTVKVRPHSRKLQPRRAWANAKRSRTAWKQKRKAAAACFAGAALGEFTGFVTLRGGGWLLIAIGIGVAAAGYATKRLT